MPKRKPAKAARLTKTPRAESPELWPGEPFFADVSRRGDASGTDSSRKSSVDEKPSISAPVESTPPRLESTPPEGGFLPPSSSASEDESSGDELIRSTPSFVQSEQLKKGDLAWAKYHGIYHIVVATGVSKKTISFKYVYDLIVASTGARPFRAAPSKFIRYRLGSLAEQSAAALSRMKDRNVINLAVEAAEAYATRLASTEDDIAPDAYFQTECDYLVRKYYGPSSPVKPLGVSVGAGEVGAPATQLAPVSGEESEGNSDSDAEEREGEQAGSDAEELASVVPPLSASQLADRMRYAESAVELIQSKACQLHLSAIGTGRRVSWRRDAFLAGQHRQLTQSAGSGDLSFYPDLLASAASAVAAFVDRQRSAPRLERQQYVWNVMLPEAVMFAAGRLAGEARTPTQLEREVLTGSSRFHTAPPQEPQSPK